MASNTLRILVVDDEVHIVESLALLLRRTLNCEVNVASSGTDALAKVQTFLPDMIIMDVVMPDISGGEVAELLQENSTTRAIPIIFFTGLVSQAEVERRSGMIGGKCYLAKPAKEAEILRAISRVCSTSP